MVETAMIIVSDRVGWRESRLSLASKAYVNRTSNYEYARLEQSIDSIGGAYYLSMRQGQ